MIKTPYYSSDLKIVLSDAAQNCVVRAALVYDRGGAGFGQRVVGARDGGHA